MGRSADIVARELAPRVIAAARGVLDGDQKINILWRDIEEAAPELRRWKETQLARPVQHWREPQEEEERHLIQCEGLLEIHPAEAGIDAGVFIAFNGVEITLW